MIARVKLDNILVVDDEPGYREIINRKLKSAGYQPVLVQNAEDALAAMWQRKQIRLVLLDIRLPVRSGLSVFDMIRREFPDKKIIVVSAFPKDDQRFLIDAADDYYDKSEDLSCLLEKIERVFHSRAAGMKKNERRQSQRAAVSVLASCKKHDHETPGVAGSHFISYTKDLSLWGGKFMVSDDIKPGQYFTASLELPAHFLPVLVDCEVRWIKKSDDEQALETGVKFVKLDSLGDEEKLKHYLSYA